MLYFVYRVGLTSASSRPSFALGLRFAPAIRAQAGG